MGSNRAGARAKQRRKRREKFENRLALKAQQPPAPEGLLEKAKDAVSSAAHTVTDAVKSAAAAVKNAVS